jgi:hypothetical protein
MTDIPNNYGEGMEAFSWTAGTTPPGAERTPLSPKTFAAVSAALDHLQIDIGQAFTNPEVRSLAERLATHVGNEQKGSL